MVGRRRSACMAVLDASHPDIYNFVGAKADAPGLEPFNLSVGVTDASCGPSKATAPTVWSTRGPARPSRGCRPSNCSPRSARPPTPAATQTPVPGHDQPGEPVAGPRPDRSDQPVRGSSAAALRVLQSRLDQLGPDVSRRAPRLGPAWRGRRTCGALPRRCQRHQRLPVSRAWPASRATRKIGLGMMGLAELFATLCIPYDGQQAVRLAVCIARHIQQAAHAASRQLAEARGPFPRLHRQQVRRFGAPAQRAAHVGRPDAHHIADRRYHRRYRADVRHRLHPRHPRPARCWRSIRASTGSPVTRASTATADRRDRAPRRGPPL